MRGKRRNERKEGKGQLEGKVKERGSCENRRRMMKEGGIGKRKDKDEKVG